MKLAHFYIDGIIYNNSWHERGYNSYQIGDAFMKIGGLEVAISQSMSA